MSDIVDGVSSYLRTFTALTDLLPAKTGDGFDAWIFQGELFAEIQRSSKCAVVISQRGGWTTPNLTSTARFPRIFIEVYADPDRSDDGQVLKPNGAAKAAAIWDELHTALHRPYGFDEVWGACRVITSVASDEPDYFDVPASDQLKVARGYFALTQAGRVPVAGF